MAETNFLQWNPDKNNQETDEQWLIEPQRVNGAPLNPSGTIFPSWVANKCFYQTTTMVKAIADVMVSKGYDISDENLSVLTNTLSNILTTPEMVAYAAKINGDVNQYFSAKDAVSGKQVVNFSQFSNAKSTTGYQYFPGGLIHQWGTTGLIYGGENRLVYFPVAFPNNILVAFVTPNVTNSGGILTPAVAMCNQYNYGWPYQGGMIIYRMDPNEGTSADWFAIGY